MTHKTYQPDRMPTASPAPEEPLTMTVAFALLGDQWGRWAEGHAEEHSAWLKSLYFDQP
ncbi:hypothetical protein ABT026_17085 [Streptomyces sp. NPDC002734]|uniref:hypothetical protein n=1 Tax=Streptomyces sp. NPDC002734 TaxID=3154426 RepID=UPI003326A7E3